MSDVYADWMLPREDYKAWSDHVQLTILEMIDRLPTDMMSARLLDSTPVMAILLSRLARRESATARWIVNYDKRDYDRMNLELLSPCAAIRELTRNHGIAVRLIHELDESAWANGHISMPDGQQMIAGQAMLSALEEIITDRAHLDLLLRKLNIPVPHGMY
jgi:hypothetical protein